MTTLADLRQPSGEVTAASPRPDAGSRAASSPSEYKVSVERLNLWYGAAQALREISLGFANREVTALIGPSGSGKSTLLRTINRMHELTPGVRTEGAVRLDGEDLLRQDPVLVRRRVGMVFQAPNPFPKSIYKNVAWGAKINGYTGDMDALVERALRQAALWDEVRDRLRENAYGLSGGQQQRLCIARTLAIEPEVILMDEPTSALDPRASALIEETIGELKKSYTVVVVTHNLQQAKRVSDQTAFLYDGALIEAGPTAELFANPQHERTKAYVGGRFG